MTLDPKALEAAVDILWPLQEWEGEEDVCRAAARATISAYIDALPQAEPVAWRWRVQPDGSWFYSAAKPSFAVSDLAPLFASPTPAEPSPATGVRVAVKHLVWSDHSPPNDYCSYNHCFADAAIGRYQIEWKGWKDHPSYGLVCEGRYIIDENGLDAAKAAAQSDYEARIRSALGEQS